MHWKPSLLFLESPFFHISIIHSYHLQYIKSNHREIQSKQKYNVMTKAAILTKTYDLVEGII